MQSEKLKKLTDAVLAGRSKSPWPWALIRDHFPAASDEESRAQLEAWARENHIDARIESEEVSTGQRRHTIRVVVLEPRRKPPIRIRGAS